MTFDINLSLRCLASLGSSLQLRRSLDQRGRRRRQPSLVVEGDAVEMQSYSEPVPPTEEEASAHDTELTAMPPIETAVAEWGAALLELDPDLARLRFEMVPAKLAEEAFWSVCFLEARRMLWQALKFEDVEDSRLFCELERGLQAAYTSDSVRESCSAIESPQLCDNSLDQLIGKKAAQALAMQGAEFGRTRSAIQSSI